MTRRPDLARRIEEAYRRTHPDASSAHGARVWFARLARAHPTTVSRWLAGELPTDRAEALLDALEMASSSQ